jgi:hypothetical protein
MPILMAEESLRMQSGKRDVGFVSQERDTVCLGERVRTSFRESKTSSGPSVSTALRTGIFWLAIDSSSNFSITSNWRHVNAHVTWEAILFVSSALWSPEHACRDAEAMDRAWPEIAEARRTCSSCQVSPWSRTFAGG